MCVCVCALGGGVEEGQILGSSAELFTEVKRQEKYGGGGGGGGIVINKLQCLGWQLKMNEVKL